GGGRSERIAAVDRVDGHRLRRSRYEGAVGAVDEEAEDVVVLRVDVLVVLVGGEDVAEGQRGRVGHEVELEDGGIVGGDARLRRVRRLPGKYAQVGVSGSAVVAGVAV